MKYFILLAMSLVLICFSACGEESCDDTSAPSEPDVAAQVGDAVSEISSDAVAPEEPSDVVADDTATDVAEAEDVQPEAVSDTAAPEDTASSSD
jgi:hypothetical protein